MNIQADLNNAIVWMVSICPPISTSSSPLSRPLGTIPSTPVTTVISITLRFYCFLSCQAKSKNLFLILFSLIFTLESTGMAKSTIQQVLFFMLIIIRPDLLVGISWSVCISKSERIFYISFSKMNSDLCMYIW